MSSTTPTSSFKLQYLILSKHLFGNALPDPKTVAALDAIAHICLREIYKISYSGRSDLAKRAWIAQHVDSDFRLLQLAFRSLGKEAAHPTVKQSWDLPAYYSLIRAKKLKKGRLELWAILAPHAHHQLPANIISWPAKEVELKFNAWLEKHNGLPQLSKLRIDRSSQRHYPIPPEVGQLQSLTKLRVKYSSKQGGLKSLPPEISQLRFLKNLKIIHHDFRAFPSVILQLPSLKKLDLRGNPTSFVALPPQIAQLNALEEIVLLGPIGTLPYEISQLRSLWKFKIDSVLLAASPPEIREFWQSVIVESFRKGLSGG